MSTGLFVICIAAIVISIVLAFKTGINLGFPSLVFAFVIGYFFLGQTPSQVYSHISLSLLRSFTLVCGMFYFVRKNGAIEGVGRRLLYACRKIPWAINLVFYLLGALMCFIGADTASIMALTTAIAFSMYKSVNVHPLAMLMALGLGGGSFSLVPWGFNGLTISGTLEQYFSVEETYNICWTTSYTVVLVKFLAVLLITFLTGSFKTKGELTVEKPAPFTKEQKITLWTTFLPMAIGVFFTVTNNFVDNATIAYLQKFFGQIYVMATISIVINVMLKMGDAKEVITKGMPWNIVMLINGMYCLIGVCTDAGMADVIANFMSNALPVFLIGPVLTLLGGVMSVFAGATTTVFALLMAVGIPLCELTGLTPQYIVSAILCGSMVTAMSPFSTGGALLMGYSSDIEELHVNNMCFKYCLMGAGISLAVSTIITLLHIYPGN